MYMGNLMFSWYKTSKTIGVNICDTDKMSTTVSKWFVYRLFLNDPLILLNDLLPIRSSLFYLFIYLFYWSVFTKFSLEHTCWFGKVLNFVYEFLQYLS